MLFIPNTGTDVALAIEQSVYILKQAALQAEDVAHPVRQGHLCAHDPGEVLQQLLECSELFIVDCDHGTLKKFVPVYEEFDFFGPLLAGHLDEGGAMGTEKKPAK
jgi:hypothetical protein